MAATDKDVSLASSAPFIELSSLMPSQTSLPEVVTPPPSDGISSVVSPSSDYKPKPVQHVNSYGTQSPVQAPPQQGPPPGLYAQPPPGPYAQPPPGPYAQPPQMYPQPQQSFPVNPEQYAQARARTAKSKGFCGGIIATLACCCCLDYCCCC